MLKQADYKPHWITDTHKTEADSLLATKQNTIVDGSLTIARTSGLQTELNSRYTKTETDTLLNNKLSATGSIPISQVTNLQTSLDNKAPFSALGDDPNYATTISTQLTSITNALNGKLATTGSIPISQVPNLQTTLKITKPHFRHLVMTLIMHQQFQLN